MSGKEHPFIAALPVRAGIGARPFYALTNEESPESGWAEDEVHVFHAGTEIGKYQRPPDGMHGATTFEAFERDGRWYALYSADYTCTRVMTLPDCIDIGGEEPASDGFCPVEIYVPRYRVVNGRYRGGYPGTDWVFESKGESVSATDKAGPWQSLDVGFVHGCYWGCPYEVQVFDLSRAAEGILACDRRFDDVEIPDYLPLVSIIRLSRRLPEALCATILRLDEHDVASGQRIRRRP